MFCLQREPQDPKFPHSTFESSFYYSQICKGLNNYLHSSFMYTFLWWYGRTDRLLNRWHVGGCCVCVCVYIYLHIFFFPGWSSSLLVCSFCWGFWSSWHHLLPLPCSSIMSFLNRSVLYTELKMQVLHCLNAIMYFLLFF